ncbi:MAG: hypothetical protein RBQ97_04490 [Acholeplasma sp.]|nr:hypothetical protein [Acholeplasma sp.]
MDKNRGSFLTAISAVFLTFINGLFALVITKEIILLYGSDFNGLNASANQFISMLLIVEGGFTIASNVALFKPMAIKDYVSINAILSATHKIFNKIGIIFFSVGTILSIFYASIINSEISPFMSFLIFFMTIVSTFVNLYFATKYRILLQSENKEYVLNNMQSLTSVLSQTLILITIFFNGHFLLIRFSTMLGAIINSYLIASVTKAKYKFIDFEVLPDYTSIKGTNDLFIQKITGMIYSTIPLLFISATVGTIYASIYVVYNNVIRLIKSIIYSFINAPVMSFGKLLAEKDKNYILKIFLQYEYIVIFILSAFLSTTTVLIMPFIEIYIRDITDINYFNWNIAIMLILITFFEIIHIPSGNIINISGKFKVGKNIQSISSFVIIITMLIGNRYFGFYGIIFAVLFTAIVLGALEIVYVHKVFFNNSLMDFMNILFPSITISILVILLEINYLPVISNYLDFFIWGALIIILNSAILVVVGFIFNRSIFFEVKERITIFIKMVMNKS